MKLRRFKIDKECLRGLEATITDEREIRHIAKVLRLKAGDEVILFDGEGKEYHASLTRLSPREISLRLLREPSSVAAESPLKIILGVGLLKSSKFDWLIQKTTELGVAEVVPFYSLHVVPRWKESQTRSKQSRWEKIASEAAMNGESRVKIACKAMELSGGKPSDERFSYYMQLLGFLSSDPSPSAVERREWAKQVPFPKAPAASNAKSLRHRDYSIPTRVSVRPVKPFIGIVRRTVSSR